MRIDLEVSVDFVATLNLSDFDYSLYNDNIGIKRRTLLISGGASLIIIGAVGTKFLHSDLDPARRPWLDANNEFDDFRLKALSYAILAPSPHNRQPWLVELSGDNGLTVYCDTNRLLPETDPYNRQITVGLGAFLEVLRMATAEEGYVSNIDYFPNGEHQPTIDNRPIVHVQFSKSSVIEKDSLFAFLTKRRTNRIKFNDTSVNLITLDALTSAVSNVDIIDAGYNNDDLVEPIKAICVKGWETEITTPRTHHESTKLTRVGEKAINTSPDGISLSGPMMEALGLLGQFSEEKMNDPSSKTFQGTRDFYNDLINTARAFAWIVTPDNSRSNQLKAGADWVRMHLAATREGLAFHPLSQVLQEFPEMSDSYAAIHELLRVKSPAVIQGLFRLGYASAPPAAPRWPMKSCLIEDNSR